MARKGLIYVQKTNAKFFKSFGLTFYNNLRLLLLVYIFGLETLNSETNIPFFYYLPIWFH